MVQYGRVSYQGNLTLFHDLHPVNELNIIIAAFLDQCNRVDVLTKFTV